MAASLRMSEWRKLPLSLTELCIDTTLRCGQAFRWRKIDDEWHCSLQGRVLSLKQDPTHLYYRATWPKEVTPPSTPPIKRQDDTPALVDTYFSLHLSLASLYATWSKSDPNFASRAPSFTGIRILNQDAWEALVAFICSSNNNISRISQMATKLCVHYGPYLGSVAGEEFHGFPSPEALAGDGVEEKLRSLGFGYRAKYIADTARIVSRERPEGWLASLRNPSSPALGSATATPLDDVKSDGLDEKSDPPTYKSAQEALLTLTGVGPKVADCVCLMGLGWSDAVPVDTHVWQIAQRDYKFGLKHKGKTFNKAIHDAVGDHFRAIWGEYAGWAQSVLFTANLKSFAKQAKPVVSEAAAVKEDPDLIGSLEVEKVVKVEEGVRIEETEVVDEKAKARGTRKRRVAAATVEKQIAEDAVDIKSEMGEVLQITNVRRSKRTRTIRV